MLNDALEQVMCMREDNQDVFVMGPPADNVLFAIEEMTEFWRVWQKLLNPNYLRGNDLRDIDLYLKLQLEWGQALMMLLTCAMQAEIDPDLALHSAIELTYERCKNKRRQLDGS